MKLLHRFGSIGVILACALILQGCSQLAGNLRRDLDDSDPYASGPTVGGTYPEGGFLSESMPESGWTSRPLSVGHTDRSIASSNASEAPVSRGSWVDPNQADSNRRDGYRGLADEGDSVSFANTPSMAPPTKRMYKNGGRATRDDFIDESQNEGSLWASDGQTNYYFTKNKTRAPGDIITINVEDDLARDIAQEVRRGLTPAERDAELASAQERLREKALGAGGQDQVASSAAAPDRAPAGANANDKSGDKKKAPEVQVPEASYADIDVAKSLAIKKGDTIMGEIVERYPNGNYKIRAVKKVPYKNGAPRLVTMVGVVRGSDIGEDDTLNSGKIYEYRIEAIR